MLWWFAETTFVAALLACVAALAGRLGAIGPSARHILWLVVLIKLITPPLIKAPWAVDLWPAREVQALQVAVGALASDARTEQAEPRQPYFKCQDG